MGKKISELQNKSTLSGNERIPFEQDNVNGSITTSSLKNYISHEIGEGGGGTNGGGSMNTEFKNILLRIVFHSFILILVMKVIIDMILKELLDKFLMNLNMQD